MCGRITDERHTQTFTDIIGGKGSSLVMDINLFILICFNMFFICLCVSLYVCWSDNDQTGHVSALSQWESWSWKQNLSIHWLWKESEKKFNSNNRVQHVSGVNLQLFYEVEYWKVDMKPFHIKQKSECWRICFHTIMWLTVLLVKRFFGVQEKSVSGDKWRILSCSCNSLTHWG